MILTRAASILLPFLLGAVAFAQLKIAPERKTRAPIEFESPELRRARIQTAAVGPEIASPDARGAEAIAREAIGQSVVGLQASRTQAGPVEVVRFRQRYQGVPVLGGQAMAAVDGDGRVVAAEDRISAALPLESLPLVAAEEAVELAVEALRVEVGTPTPPSLVIAPGGLLAWRVVLDTGESRYETLVAADEPRLLRRRRLAHDMGAARVWTESPLAGDPEVVVFPEGWLPPGGTVTTGNNADAYLDLNGDGRPDNDNGPGLFGGRASSPAQEFDFPTGDGSQNPLQFQAAAVTSAFYWANRAHDYFYDLGFDEGAGNFQTDNFGRGGRPRDAMVVQVQSGRSPNNASFLLAPDGENGVIRVGVFFTEEGLRDGAFSGDLMIHEYAHGVTSRVIGGPDEVDCLFGLQEDALSEAWSDYFPVSIFNDPVTGEYEAANPVSGLRRFPYDQHPLTYQDIGDPIFQEHADGEIFGAALWELREAIGAEIADQLIYNALGVTACSPSFIDARDAILALDRAAGSPNREAIWRVFARRGMGFSARGASFSEGTRTLFDAAFDLPPEFVAGNRPPRTRSSPRFPTFLDEAFRYDVAGFDPDGDPIQYSLISGPEGATIDPASGGLAWTGNFTGARFVIGLDDGRGGTSTHGFFLRSDTMITAGTPIVVSGSRRSIGLAELQVPPGMELLQVTTRGEVGDPDVALFDPRFSIVDSLGRGPNETITIREPRAGRWFVRVDGFEAYEGLTVLAEFPTVPQLEFDEPVGPLAGVNTSERFFRVTVPEGAERLVVMAAKGDGDVDIFVERGRVPLCGFASNAERTGIRCGESTQGIAAGSFERIDIENPEPGEWFLALVGFQAYSGVELRVSLEEPPVVLNAAVDGAGFAEGIGVGGVATIFGDGFASALVQAAEVPLPRELGGIQVAVDGVPAPVFSANRTQINFQLPIETIPGTTAFQVYANGALSRTLFADVELLAPRIFRYQRGDGVLDPVITHADGSLVTPDNPARPGETIVVYLTGFALVDNFPGTGEGAPADPLATSLVPVRAAVGGLAGAVSFAGLVPGFVALVQVNVTLPGDLQAGARVELTLRFDTIATPPVELATGL